MSALAVRTAPAREERLPASPAVGPIGRLGRYVATHFRGVAIAWLVVAAALASFAPRVETALSGAGWEASGSQSVRARQLIDRSFHGLSSYALTAVVHSPSRTVGDRQFRRVLSGVQRTLAGDHAVSGVLAPTPGTSISRDGHTVIVQAGAAADADAMVKAAGELESRLHARSTRAVHVELTGAPAQWSDFNTANRAAMLRSELISWPVTLAMMLLAFGSLVAAGLPLMLTMVGLASAAGVLYLGTLISPISLWAMNFALMFALALGIDYALFIVHRFRQALGDGFGAVDAAAVAMHTAGKAVLFSGVTVLISLSAVALVPSPAFRSTSLGIVLAVIFVLAAALTLLPAILAKLGPRIDRLPVRRARAAAGRVPRFRAWGERLWRRPAVYGALALVVLVALALPVADLRTAMPSIKVIPSSDPSRIGYDWTQAGFGPGAAGPVQIVAPAGQAGIVARVAARDRGIAALQPTRTAGGYALVTAIPERDPSSPAVGRTIERLRAQLPGNALVGGAVAENQDLQAALTGKTRLVIEVVLALSFLLLLFALRAPLIAAAAIAANLLATGAAFGIATWIFQDGWLHSLLGFESQGFLDAWSPVFFFSMVFAISMDYTVFLLSSAREHWDRGQDPREAMIGGLAQTGRVIFAAAAVMVAVFFTFALSGPLPPKEMGVVLGTAVLLDSTLVRLLLLPVLMRVLGRWAWYLPGWADRMLPAVTFGHA